MRTSRRTRTERDVVAAFRAGLPLDLRGRRDPAVRGDVIRLLLLGGVTAEPGTLPLLHLTGARVTGPLEVEYADVTAPVELEHCQFDAPVSFFGSHLRRLGLEGSTLPGLMIANATFDASVRLVGCRAGPVRAGLAQINGSLLMDGARVATVDAFALRVSSDVLAGDGFACAGVLRVDGAEIGAGLHCRRATFHALSARHLTARELVLLPDDPPEGGVDLSHARVGVLRDDPATWPSALCLDGFAYAALAGEPTDRRRWLRLDGGRFRPQAYAQLARVHRDAGRDDEARTVLLAGELHRREGLRWPGRWWGRLQDVTIGYGYRPLRAAAWLAGLLAVGWAVFAGKPPRAADPGSAPEFAAPVYTADLILPVVDFGQQSAFHPRGATAWFAYALIVAGLLLVTTVTAAGARRLRRD
jgi:hypothetical protein